MHEYAYRALMDIIAEVLCFEPQNESEIADALEEAGIAREDVFITSKIGPHQVFLAPI